MPNSSAISITGAPWCSETKRAATATTAHTAKPGQR